MGKLINVPIIFAFTIPIFHPKKKKKKSAIAVQF